MAKIAGFAELDVFLTRTARGVLVKTKNDMGVVANEIGRAIVPATPVDTGLARGNWQATLNIPATAPVTTLDPSGAATVLRIAAVARRMTVDNSFHLVNRVKYIGLLFDGHSAQAPAGAMAAAISAGAARGLLKINASRTSLLALGS